MSLSFCQLNQRINEQGPPPPPPPVRDDRRTVILMRVLNGLKKGFGTDDAKQLGGSFTDGNLRAPLPETGEPHQGQGANLDDKTINAARKFRILVKSDEGHWQLGRGIMDAIHRNEQPKPGHDFDRDTSSTHTLKANDGDRAKNLEGIANEIDKHSDYLSRLKQHTRPSILDYAKSESHRLKGYAEQLRIIADELQQAEDRRRPKDRVGGWARIAEPGRQS